MLEHTSPFMVDYVEYSIVVGKFCVSGSAAAPRASQRGSGPLTDRHDPYTRIYRHAISDALVLACICYKFL